MPIADRSIIGMTPRYVKPPVRVERSFCRLTSANCQYMAARDQEARREGACADHDVNLIFDVKYEIDVVAVAMDSNFVHGEQRVPQARARQPVAGTTINTTER